VAFKCSALDHKRRPESRQHKPQAKAVIKLHPASLSPKRTFIVYWNKVIYGTDHIFPRPLYISLLIVQAPR